MSISDFERILIVIQRASEVYKRADLGYENKSSSENKSMRESRNRKMGAIMECS